jgi:hypothetical protein
MTEPDNILDISRIEKQIYETYHKAFFDLIDEHVNSSTPDYDWITRLYKEIKGRLLIFIKKGSKIYNQIDESFDIELFDQMIRNSVFDNVSMLKLVENTFYWILELEAPDRDESTLESKQKILSSEPTKMVSTYLKEVHKCVDLYEQDMINFLKNN